MALEVCVDSVRSALNAVLGGATRLELCSCLDVGGLTPSMGLLRRVRQSIAMATAIAVPVHVLVRPNATERFVYSPDELQVMVEDIRLFKQEQVDGIVVGALTMEGCVDVSAMTTLMDAARPLPVTFHRAIDVCRDPIEAIDIVARLGCRRVLTSGQEPTALQGSRCIKRMIDKGIGSDLVVMPGGGIDAGNALDIVRATGATELHASCKSVVVVIDESGEPSRPRVTMGTKALDCEYVCDEQKVADLARTLKSSAQNLEQ